MSSAPAIAEVDEGTNIWYTLMQFNPLSFRQEG